MQQKIIVKIHYIDDMTKIEEKNVLKYFFACEWYSLSTLVKSFL